MKKTGLLMALAVVVSLVFSAAAQDSSWKKARTLSGIAYNSSDVVCGWIELKCGKASKANKAKVSGKLTLLGSKAVTLKATTVQTGSSVQVTFPVKGSSPLTVTITGESFTGSQSEDLADPIRVESGAPSGGLSNTTDPVVSVEYDEDAVKVPEGWDLMDELSPDGTPFTVSSKGKWTFGKASKPKYKKVREDGMTTYELVGVDAKESDKDDDDDDETVSKKKRGTNPSGMKLTYKPKTGSFTGSFKIYTTNEFSTEKKPKLKKYTAKVTGMVVDGYGFGAASVSKLGLQMSIVIE